MIGLLAVIDEIRLVRQKFSSKRRQLGHSNRKQINQTDFVADARWCHIRLGHGGVLNLATRVSFKSGEEGAGGGNSLLYCEF